uniref:Putative secreted protein n=1 Tax=Amblyomma triste TaxID=251400 RepID=A0A023G0F7_AMBTT
MTHFVTLIGCGGQMKSIALFPLVLLLFTTSLAEAGHAFPTLRGHARCLKACNPRIPNTCPFGCRCFQQPGTPWSNMCFNSKAQLPSGMNPAGFGPISTGYGRRKQ